MTMESKIMSRRTGGGGPVTTIDGSVDFATATGGHWESLDTPTSADSFVQGETYRINSVFGTKVFKYIGQDEIVVGSGSFGNSSTEKQPALFWYNLQGTASFGYYKTLNPYGLTPISTNISLGPVEFEHWVPDA